MLTMLLNWFLLFLQMLVFRCEDLANKLTQQKQLYAKTTESYNNELQAQTKLAELHKKDSEEHAEHIKKLTTAIEEVCTRI